MTYINTANPQQKLSTISISLLQIMNSPLMHHSWLQSLEDDTLIRILLLSHDPDDRELDVAQLLHLVENVISYATMSEVLVSDIVNNATAKNNASSNESPRSSEPLRLSIYKITGEILCNCTREGNIHTRTMIMFDLLESYKWDAKVVLLLASFAAIYGEFWLIMQLYPRSPLAASVAVLKQLAVADISTLRPQFKALGMLIKTMVDMTKSIIKFEGLPVKEVTVETEIISTARSQICVAAYWISRSILICSSQIKDLIAIKPEDSDSTTIAAWELLSLVSRLSAIKDQLRQQVEECHRQTAIKLHQKLTDIFKDAHADNQEVLRLLFALKNELPFKNCFTQEKLGVSELKDKIVILLVSKPELFPLEKLLLLIQKTNNHLNKKLEQRFEIVWVPISVSDTWTEAEIRSFTFLSSCLLWNAVQQPQSIHSGVVSFIRQEWKFNDEVIMIVLDSQGMVTNTNALDMLLIWGVRGYPFSVSKETELWKEENWTLQLLVDEIDPLLTAWVEEGRNIFLYGSDNLNWIRKFNAEMKKIASTGLQLEIVYVGKSNPGQKVQHLLTTINEEMHSNLLSFTKIQFFWFRLESMKKSKIRVGKVGDADHVLQEVLALIANDDDDDDNNGWAVIGKGSSTDIFRLQGRKLIECLKLFPRWGENVGKLGFMDALRNAVEPSLAAQPCSHSKVIPYAEGSADGIELCEKCKCLMKKYVVYE